jgi:hypothetical protein
MENIKCLTENNPNIKIKIEMPPEKIEYKNGEKVIFSPPSKATAHIRMGDSIITVQSPPYAIERNVESIVKSLQGAKR